MEYFSSEEQENSFDKKYKELIIQKQKEIDALQKETKKIQKYTAYAYIDELPRVFFIQDGLVYLDGTLCPTHPVQGGKRYVLDRDFTDKIHEFLNKYRSYKVVFYPSGKYGPTTHYCSYKDVVPAKMIAPENYELSVEDESKYDILCL